MLIKHLQCIYVHCTYIVNISTIGVIILDIDINADVSLRILEYLRTEFIPVKHN